MNLFSNNYNLCVEIPLKAKFLNLNYAIFPCIERKRIADKKKVKPFKVGFEILFFLIINSLLSKLQKDRERLESPLLENKNPVNIKIINIF